MINATLSFYYRFRPTRVLKSLVETGRKGRKRRVCRDILRKRGHVYSELKQTWTFRP